MARAETRQQALDAAGRSLDQQLSNQLNTQLNENLTASNNERLAQINNTARIDGAANLTNRLAEQRAVSDAEFQKRQVELQNRGVGLATNFVGQRNALFNDLNTRALNVRSIQSRVLGSQAQNTIREAPLVDPIAQAELLARPRITGAGTSPESTTLLKTSFELTTARNKQGRTVPKAGFKGQLGSDNEVKNSFVFDGDKITSTDGTNAFGVTVNAENKRFSNTFLNENGRVVNETGGGTDFNVSLFQHKNDALGTSGEVRVFGVATEGKVETIIDPATGHVQDVSGSVGGNINIINAQFGIEGTDAFSIFDISAKVDGNLGFGPGIKFVQQGNLINTERSLFRGKIQADVQVDVNQQRLQNNRFIPDFVKELLDDD